MAPRTPHTEVKGRSGCISLSVAIRGCPLQQDLPGCLSSSSTLVLSSLFTPLRSVLVSTGSSATKRSTVSVPAAVTQLNPTFKNCNCLCFSSFVVFSANTITAEWIICLLVSLTCCAWPHSVQGYLIDVCQCAEGCFCRNEAETIANSNISKYSSDVVNEGQNET